MNNEKPKSSPDWELIEFHYRAGVLTVRQIAKEFGVSHTAIQKRATKLMWARDLSEKIRQTTQNMVATQVVAKSVAMETKLSESQVVKGYSDIAASVDIEHREAVALTMATVYGQAKEIAALGDPKFKEGLEALSERLAGSVTDRDIDMFRYVISLAGRVKLSKEVASAHGIYIPMQRKMFGLDSEKASTAAFEDLLRSIGNDE